MFRRAERLVCSLTKRMLPRVRGPSHLGRGPCVVVFSRKNRAMRAIIPFVVTILSACATASSGGSESVNYEPIGQQELHAAGVGNGEQTVRQLRPGWELRQRLQSEIVVIKEGDQGWTCYTNEPTLLYVDGRKWGQRPRGFSSLSQISVERIREIHYIQPSEPRPDGETRCGGLPAIHVMLIAGR